MTTVQPRTTSGPWWQWLLLAVLIVGGATYTVVAEIFNHTV